MLIQNGSDSSNATGIFGHGMTSGYVAPALKAVTPTQQCPSCGYCPHCGRSNTTPYYYMNTPAVTTWVNSDGNGTTGTFSVGSTPTAGHGG